MSACWRLLVRRYADGRPICNCGEAWMAPCAHGFDGNGDERLDMLGCKHGCQANLIECKNEIAKRIMEEHPAETHQ